MSISARPKTLKLTAPEASEADIQAALMRRLQRAGWLVVRINSGGFKTASGGFFRAYVIGGLWDEKGRPVCSGFPDVLALKCEGEGEDERVTARLFEVKKGGGVVSPAQERFRAFAQARGVTVVVVEGWDEMERLTAEMCG